MKRIKILLSAYLCFGMMIFATVNAAAYIDPSVVSYAAQAIAGIVIAAGAVFFVWWRKVKKKVSKKLGIDENAGKEVEEDIVINEDDETKSENVTHEKSENDASEDETDKNQ